MAAAPVDDSTPTDALARTGADATPWLIGGAAVLIAGGGGSLLLARRSRASTRTDGSTDS
ncbi:LAETG motif-containing sortase-dependent surface protein [Streptomyces parvus]|uniref:LAETG motif-containing sortase-dependent surface protein n=1 Tax=Streptomyces parvus TaxID=66428 RepID=UPI00292A3ED1|nr:LAETG motif-containing sortase-dependent surface protein [Streptomyces parvus]